MKGFCEVLGGEKKDIFHYTNSLLVGTSTVGRYCTSIRPPIEFNSTERISLALACSGRSELASGVRYCSLGPRDNPLCPNEV